MSDSEPRRDPKGTELEYLETIPLSSEDRVLDIGCGDGMLGGLLEQKGSDIQVEGYEILARPDTPIPVYEFDGRCGECCLQARQAEHILLQLQSSSPEQFYCQ